MRISYNLGMKEQFDIDFKNGRITCTMSAWTLLVQGVIDTKDAPGGDVTITFADIDTSVERFADFLDAVRAGRTEYDWRAPIKYWHKGGDTNGKNTT